MRLLIICLVFLAVSGAGGAVILVGGGAFFEKKAACWLLSIVSCRSGSVQVVLSPRLCRGNMLARMNDH